MFILFHLLVAVFAFSLTCTVISVDNGLLRTSTGCARINPSLAVNDGWLNVTVIAIQDNHYENTYKQCCTQESWCVTPYKLREVKKHNLWLREVKKHNLWPDLNSIA